MRTSRLTAIGIISTLLLAFGIPYAQEALAASSADPNSAKVRAIDFRRLSPRNRYDYNKRSIERRITEFMSGSGTISSFDRRARILREAQLRRVLEGLEEKVFTGEGRDKTSFEEHEQNLKEQQRKRLQERLKERKFDPSGQRRSVYRRQRTRESLPSILLRKKRQDDMRLQLKDRETKLIKSTTPKSCEGQTRSRLSKCLYRMQVR